MQSGLIRWLLPYVAAAVVAAAAAWWLRGLLSDNEVLGIHAEYAEQERARQLAKQVIDVANQQNTQQSTERVDKVEAQHQVDVRYVDREVIKYVASKPQSCVLDPQWVCLANAALGLPCGATAPGP